MFYNGYLRPWIRELRKMSDNLGKARTDLAQSQVLLQKRNDVQMRAMLYRQLYNQPEHILKRYNTDRLYAVAIDMLDSLSENVLVEIRMPVYRLLLKANHYVQEKGKEGITLLEVKELEAIISYLNEQYRTNELGFSAATILTLARLKAKTRSLNRDSAKN